MSPLAVDPGTSSPPAFDALVVDDDDFVRTVVAQQLRGLGAGEITLASGGHQARELLRDRRHFELIVCDLMMPDSDGVELLRDIASESPGSALIFMSSADPKVLRSVEHIAVKRMLHVLGSVQKPIRSASLKELVRRMDRGRPDCPDQQPCAGVSEAMLRDAILNHRIRIAVQPQLNLLTGEVESAEALARWTRDDGTAIGPGLFLPLAERCGLMDALTDSVVEQALAAVGTLHRAGIRMRIAINISPSTLAQPILPEHLVAVARRHGVQASQIVIEVTETGIAGDALPPLEVLTRFRLRGMELAIDDFGTGYSSLARLRHIPFTELKIDRSFVAAARADQEARRIVESSVRLARDLGLRTVAEGIERCEDAALMRALGCDLGQGFHFARPMPPAQLLDWIGSR